MNEEKDYLIFHLIQIDGQEFIYKEPIEDLDIHEFCDTFYKFLEASGFRKDQIIRGLHLLCWKIES